jgi:hypothetical protein
MNTSLNLFLDRGKSNSASESGTTSSEDYNEFTLISDKTSNNWPEWDGEVITLYNENIPEEIKILRSKCVGKKIILL